MKEYKNLSEKEPQMVSEPAEAVVYSIPQPQHLIAAPEFKIPRDENGKPIGIPWEEVIERMYDNLSEHYGVDLRTL